MNETSWLHVDNYNTDLDLDFFDDYMVSEWIDSFEFPDSIQADIRIATAEEDSAIIYNDDEIANSSFGNHQEYLFTSSNRVPEASPQPDNVSATTPLERFSAPVQLASNASPRRPEKRSFEDCLSEFVGTEPVVKGAKRRERYSTENRKKVDQVRKAGACIRCKLMKTPVSHLRMLLPRDLNTNPLSSAN
jgi:hypothetical protein